MFHTGMFLSGGWQMATAAAYVTEEMVKQRADVLLKIPHHEYV